MKANKVVVTITVEVLHIDAAPALIQHVIAGLDNEFESGALCANDGDTVSWETERRQVTF